MQTLAPLRSLSISCQGDRRAFLRPTMCSASLEICHSRTARFFYHQSKALGKEKKKKNIWKCIDYFPGFSQIYIYISAIETITDLFVQFCFYHQVKFQSRTYVVLLPDYQSFKSPHKNVQMTTNNATRYPTHTGYPFNKMFYLTGSNCLPFKHGSKLNRFKKVRMRNYRTRTFCCQAIIIHNRNQNTAGCSLIGKQHTAGFEV